jgi:hypothetical protein
MGHRSQCVSVKWGFVPSVAHRASGDCSTVAGGEISASGKMRIQEQSARERIPRNETPTT